MHQINHEARINPDLFAAGRLTMHACIKRPQCHDIRRLRCGGLRQHHPVAALLATPADVAGVWIRGERAAGAEPALAGAAGAKPA